jgi:regulation of enolase protein 1 (concanavalin A-like superfamily)
MDDMILSCSVRWGVTIFPYVDKEWTRACVSFETQHWKLVCVTNLSIDSIVDVGVCLMCFQTESYTFRVYEGISLMWSYYQG